MQEKYSIRIQNLNKSYKYFCDHNKDNKKFSWVDIKKEAYKAEDSEAFMTPFLFMRELLNIYVLIKSVEQMETKNFCSTHLNRGDQSIEDS